MFEPREAKQLQPGQHITIDGCPGLRLEASVKYRTWTYRYRSPANGKLRQVKLGQWPSMPLSDAIASWVDKRKQKESGIDPAIEKKKARIATAAAAELAAAPKARTVGEIANKYLHGHVKVRRKEKGFNEIRRMFETMLGDDAAMPAATYERSSAFALLERHLKTPVQAGKLRAELGAAWDRALDSGDLPPNTPNWWRQIMRGKIKTRSANPKSRKMGTSKRALKDQEVGKLLWWIPNFTALIEDVLIMYLWTGCRGSEIVSIEAEEVTEEVDGLWWTIPVVKTKNAGHEDAYDLRVPLIGRAEAVVRRRIARFKSGYLFPSGGKYGHTEQKTIESGVYYRQPYSKTRPEYERSRLEVTHWSPHDLRRTVRTALASMGCPDDVAESVLGHMIEGVRGVYNVHRYDKERRQWLTKISNRWEALAIEHKA